MKEERFQRERTDYTDGWSNAEWWSLGFMWGIAATVAMFVVFL